MGLGLRPQNAVAEGVDVFETNVVDGVPVGFQQFMNVGPVGCVVRTANGTLPQCRRLLN